MFVSEKERSFFCNWYFRANLDENYDADRRFFYFYALFDQMTKSYAQEKRKNLAEQGLQLAGGERGLIKYFLYQLFYIDEESNLFKTFNPLKTLESGKQFRLIEKLKSKDSDNFTEDFSLPPFNVMITLFMEIYDIRCKLFHGDADLADCENNKLIDEANVVLEGFFDRLLAKFIK